MTKLTEDSARQLRKRAEVGESCIEIAGGPGLKVVSEDRETYAKDAISDILTALFGAAGTHSMGGSLTPNVDALGGARRVLEEAFESWEGDAEDYTREPEPGEYGHEEPS